MEKLFLLALFSIVSTLNIYSQVSHLNLPDSLLLKKIKMEGKYQTESGYWAFKSTNEQDIYLFISNTDGKKQEEIIKNKNKYVTLKFYNHNICINGDCTRDTTKFELTNFIYEDGRLRNVIKKNIAGETLQSSAINYHLDGRLSSAKTKCNYFFNKHKYTSIYKYENNKITETIIRDEIKYAERITNYSEYKKIISNNVWDANEYKLISKEILELNEKDEVKSCSINYFMDNRLWSIIKKDKPIDFTISFD